MLRETMQTNRELVAGATFINFKCEVVGINKFCSDSLVLHAAIDNIVHIFLVLIKIETGKIKVSQL